MIGGVKTNIWGETNIAGLFASGEAACTGVHGANRLASNSLLEAVVFGKRIAQKTARGFHLKTTTSKQSLEIHQLPERRSAKKPPVPSLSALQQLHWDKVGIVRDRKGLLEASNTLAGWHKALPPPTDRPTYELNNLILTGRLVAEAALIREESRGAHFRTDFPKSSPDWQHHIVFTVC
jgi:L-aspartate oxidase